MKKAPHIPDRMAAQGKRFSCGTRIEPYGENPGADAGQAVSIGRIKLGRMRQAQPA